MNIKTVVWGVCVAGLLGYVLFTGLRGNQAVQKNSTITGKPAPEFVLESFDGDKIALSDYRGKTVLLNFWASWCEPCKREAPALEKTYSILSNNQVEFIGINVMDQKKDAERFLDLFGGDFVNVYDPKKKIHIDYGISGVPETYFIDSDGIIVAKYRGQLTEGIIMHYMEKASRGSRSSLIIHFDDMLYGKKRSIGFLSDDTSSVIPAKQDVGISTCGRNPARVG